MLSTSLVAQRSKVKPLTSKSERAPKNVYELFDPKDELVHKRDRTSVHYRNKKGTLTAIVTSGSSINYREDNQWKPVKNEIHANNTSENKDYSLANTANRFKSYYAAKSDKGVKVEFEEGTVVEWKNPQMAWLDINGTVIGKVVKGATVPGIVDKNTITYHAVFNGIDVKLTQENDGRKLDIIINSKSALSGRPVNAKSLVFYENIAIPSDWQVELKESKGRITGSTALKSILLLDANSTEIVRYTEPIYYELNPNSSSNSNTDLSSRGTIDGSYIAEIKNQSLLLGLDVPLRWLLDTSRAFPVIIDPSGIYYPTNTAWWTGSVYRDDDSPNSKTSYSDWVDIGWYDRSWPSSNDRSHAWSKFDITSIPDAAEITKVKVRLYAYQYGSGGGNTTSYFAHYADGAQDPVTRTTSQRYTDIINATSVYGTFTFSTGSSTYYTIDMLTTPLADVKSRLVANWYTLAFECKNTGTGGGFGDDSYYYYFRGHSSADKPRLEIDYCDYSPTAAAGTDQEVCATTATMAATAPAAGETGAWTLVSGAGTITTASSNVSGLTALGAGANTFRWTITITDGGCTSSDDVIITNSSASTSAAGTDQTVCTSTTSLGGNNPTNGTGVWTVISGTGTFTDNTLYNTVVSNLTGSAAGTTNDFQWTISNGTGDMCTSSDNVIITYAFPPTADAGVDQTGCFGGTTATMAANNPTPGTGAWTVVSGAGTFTTSTLFNTTVSNIGTGANTYRWTVTHGNGVCTSVDNVVITNNSGTTANAGPDQSISANNTTLAGNNPTVGVGTWTFITTDGAATITTPGNYNTTVTGITSDFLYTLRWTISSGACTSTFDEMNIYWDPGLLGLIIEGDLTNEGTFIQTNDPNYFFMT
ncbi:MAG: hypothetical protein JKY52_06450, partial [Flavobacteriales bacterium]|nr:hypothetical protein [Flavobacteriales bacterium]